MVTLRWVLGLVLAVMGGGFFALTMFARGFRQSFGASPLNPLFQILPLAAMVLLLAGLIAPSNRLLMHAGAVAAVGLIGFCVWQMIAESAAIVWVGVLYLVVWLYFYWKSVHATVGA